MNQTAIYAVSYEIEADGESNTVFVATSHGLEDAIELAREYALDLSNDEDAKLCQSDDESAEMIEYNGPSTYLDRALDLKITDIARVVEADVSGE